MDYKRRKKKNAASLWLMLAAIVALGLLIWLLPSCGSRTDGTTLVREGDAAPDFTVEMVDGRTLTLSELEGRVVLLQFWATWCPPCRAELARAEQELVGRFAGQPFIYLPVSRGEERATVEAFLRGEGYRFASGIDPDEMVYGLYATDYIPRNFLIDREGRIVRATVGYTPAEFDELVHAIEEELDEQ